MFRLVRKILCYENLAHSKLHLKKIIRNYSIITTSWSYWLVINAEICSTPLVSTFNTILSNTVYFNRSKIFHILLDFKGNFIFFCRIYERIVFEKPIKICWFSTFYWNRKVDFFICITECIIFIFVFILDLRWILNYTIRFLFIVII